MSLVNRIEQFIKSYVALKTPEVVLPIALWIIGTYCFRLFDSFAYIVITSKTKRSGKTRLSEVVSFASSSPMNFSSMTPSTLFRVINPDPKRYYPEHDPFVPPTIVFDEAESLSSEAVGTMRSVLNAGYRKGQSVPRTVGQEVIQFQVYCPKVFILIGDVYDTLRDRSVIVDMKRADAPKRFMYDEAQREGVVLRAEIKEELKKPETLAVLRGKYETLRAGFLSDRDEEIWLPLFALCQTLAPERMRELQRIAVDLCALKTADKQAYKNLNLFESQSEQKEYAERAAIDLLAIINGEKAISTSDAVTQMRDLDLSPWRTFRGKGIDQHSLSDLLAGIGIPSVNVRFGKSVLKGYRKLDVETVMKSLGRVTDTCRSDGKPPCTQDCIDGSGAGDKSRQTSPAFLCNDSHKPCE